MFYGIFSVFLSNIVSFLSLKGDSRSFPKKIEIFTDKNENNCIVMIRCKIYISSADKDDSQKIKKEIENKLNIATEVISI